MGTLNRLLLVELSSDTVGATAMAAYATQIKQVRSRIVGGKRIFGDHGDPLKRLAFRRGGGEGINDEPHGF